MVPLAAAGRSAARRPPEPHREGAIAAGPGAAEDRIGAPAGRGRLCVNASASLAPSHTISA